MGWSLGGGHHRASYHELQESTLTVVYSPVISRARVRVTVCMFTESENREKDVVSVDCHMKLYYTVYSDGVACLIKLQEEIV